MEILFCYPGKAFPGLSLTGPECRLGCDHCRGRYLQGMLHVTEPSELINLANDLRSKGARGMLISGGCDADGKIPFNRFIDAIGTVKKSTGMEMNIHTGLLDLAGAEALMATGADCFSVDVVSETSVIKNVLHLDVTREAYRETLVNLQSVGAGRIVPHICVGLPRSSPEGEMESLEMVSRMDISSLVILGFVPTRGTPYQDHRPASSERILRIIREAKRMLDCPVLLGCMRPRGDRSLEIGALELKVDGIAVPSREAVEWSREKGYEMSVEERCCALYR